MSLLGEVRAGIADALSVIAQLDGRARVAKTIDGVQAIVLPADGAFNQASGVASGPLNLIVRIFVPRSDVEDAQDLLDAFLEPTGDTSVKAAIEADKTLGGVVDDLLVTGWKDYGPRSIESANYLAVDVTVTVYP